MSSNNQNSSAAAGVGFVLAGVMFLAMFLFALLAFFSFVLTVLCVFAWNKTVRIGTLVIEPKHARGFVWRGLMGAFLTPLFVAFCSLAFNIAIVWDYLPHMVFGGYAFGSLGLELLFAGNANATPEPEIIPPAQLPHTGGASDSQAQIDAEPFRYASWDDEEAGK